MSSSNNNNNNNDHNKYPDIRRAPQAPDSPPLETTNTDPPPTTITALPVIVMDDKDAFAANVKKGYDSLSDADLMKKDPVLSVIGTNDNNNDNDHSASTTEHRSNVNNNNIGYPFTAFPFPNDSSATTAAVVVPASPGVGLPGPSLKKPSHGRTVSWGLAATTTAPQQPSSSSRSPMPSWEGGASPMVPRPPRSRNTSTADDNTSSSGVVVNKKEDLDLRDIVNSGVHKEMEAETYILQAVEKLNITNKPPLDADTSRLYSTIAEDGIRKEWMNNNTSNSLDHSMEKDEDHSSLLYSPPLSPMSNSSSHGQSPPRMTTSSSSPPVTPRPPMPPKQQSMRFHGFTADGAANTIHDPSKATTVEGTLFGLASVLNTLGASQRNIASGAGGSSHHRRHDSIAYDTNFTAADKLANTAQQIIQGNHPKDGSNTTAEGVHAVTPTSDTVPSATGGNEGGPDNSGNNSDSFHHDGSGGNRKHRRSNRLSLGVKGAKSGAKQEWELFNAYFTTRKAHMKAFTRKIIVMIMLPSLAFAFFLFYAVENPELCKVGGAKVNGTVAPTAPPTMAPSSMAPSTMFPSSAPSETTLWAVSWGLGNETAPGNNNTETSAVDDVNVTDEVVTPAPTPIPGSLDEAVQDFLVCPGLGASVSWWFIFLGVRQVLTFTLALVTQSLVIDYMALSSRLFLDWLGPIVTLLVVQSKGWPFILVTWAAFDLILLSGDHDFSHHWGFWQDWIGLFNDENPSGNVVSNDWNFTILINAILIGCAVAGKRLVVGLFLGRQTFVHYGEQLAAVMKNMVLIGEVATLARQIENSQESFRDRMVAQMSVASNIWSPNNIQDMVNQEADDFDKKEDIVVDVGAADAANAFMAKRKNVDTINGKDAISVASMRSLESTRDPEFTKSQQMEMATLLDAWEDPTTVEEQEEKKVTIGAVLQFRQALTFMKKKYPFMPAFGPADTREACIESAQRLFDRLILRTPERHEIPFETLALVAKDSKGRMDQAKAKELIHAFRPDRDGSLDKLEFVKSIDVIYKELRLLSANISNSSFMDDAVENIVNVGFYIVLGAVIIYRLGEDPLALFLSFSSVILAFAFMFGKSASKYFDGCLFILIQRPYGVGDRIHLSNPQNETSPDGSSGWIVESISLFTTSVFWGATSERATLCNGAISNLRVINAARSPNAVVYVSLKFGIDTEYEKVEIFRSAVEQYLKDRPREWLTFVGFRPTDVAPDKGYIGYKVIAQHRNSWQVAGGIAESRASLTTYCLEVSKQLEMRYHAPSLPVELTMKDDFLNMPTLANDQGMDERSFASAASLSASPREAREALANINTGLRQRKPVPKFADIVKMAMAQNKND